MDELPDAHTSSNHSEVTDQEEQNPPLQPPASGIHVQKSARNLSLDISNFLLLGDPLPVFVTQAGFVSLCTATIRLDHHKCAL